MICSEWELRNWKFWNWGFDRFWAQKGSIFHKRSYLWVKLTKIILPTSSECWMVFFLFPSIHCNEFLNTKSLSPRPFNVSFEMKSHLGLLLLLTGAYLHSRWIAIKVEWLFIKQMRMRFIQRREYIFRQARVLTAREPRIDDIWRPDDASTAIHRTAPCRSQGASSSLQFELFNAKTDLKYVFHSIPESEFRWVCAWNVSHAAICHSGVERSETEIRGHHSNDTVAVYLQGDCELWAVVGSVICPSLYRVYLSSLRLNLERRNQSRSAGDK